MIDVHYLDLIKQYALSLGFLRVRLANCEEGGRWLMVALPYLPATPAARRYFGLYTCHDNYTRAVDLLKQVRQKASELLSVSPKSMRIICNSRETEKKLAASCGLGYYGKNSLIIIPNWGSFCVLAALHLPIDDAPDAPLPSVAPYHCGSCQLCRFNCPVRALETPYQLEVEQCAQQWASTGQQPPDHLLEQAPKMILGCDRCQTCCPKNIKAMQYYKQMAELADDQPWTDIHLWLQEDAEQRGIVIKSSPLKFKWLDKDNLRENAIRCAQYDGLLS
jgi:epoxyqueuosine reductase